MRQQQQPPPSHDPVLTAEDEAFLRGIMTDPASSSQESAPQATELNRQISPVSPVGTEVQEPPSAQSPVSPVEEYGRELGEEERKAREATAAAASTDRNGSTAGVNAPEAAAKVESSSPPQRKGPWGWLRRRSTVMKKV